MATVVPVDEFVTDEWYPGFKPAYGDEHWFADRADTFAKEDEKDFWFLDFHWPRGLTPMGWIWTIDGYNWSTQLAADAMPLPPGHGMTSRMAGTHLYGSAVPEADPLLIRQRARRLERYLPGFLENFTDIWAERRTEVNELWDHFAGQDLRTKSLSELGDYLRGARAFHRRAFEIHFEIMYPLLANFLGFYGACTGFGIEPVEIGKFLQGWDTKIMETDRELGKLTTAARAAGLGPVFAASDAEELRSALTRHGGPASAWLTRFDDFLGVYGYRTEGSCDPALPSWLEDPTPALGMVKTLLLRSSDHDFDKAREAAVAEREGAIDAARSKLTLEEQRVFDAGLASCQAANFPWWQDDHNYFIDLRVSLPMRWASLAIAERCGARNADDALYLFWPEIMNVTHGVKDWSSYSAIIEVRRQYFEHWYARRSSMPKVLGTVPESVEDPIMIEVFGLNAHSLKAMGASATAASLRSFRGIAASKGRARGRARVLTNADQLHRLSPGEILVCESTSPNWTPAFGKIAACVCDGGGTLSHAAIVGREYGIPVVTAAGIATVAIKDGDDVEVDGTTGQVTIHG